MHSHLISRESYISHVTLIHLDEKVFYQCSLSRGGSVSERDVSNIVLISSNRTVVSDLPIGLAVSAFVVRRAAESYHFQGE